MQGYRAFLRIRVIAFYFIRRLSKKEESKERVAQAIDAFIAELSIPHAPDSTTVRPDSAIEKWFANSNRFVVLDIPAYYF
jgi:hypothetical protein